MGKYLVVVESPAKCKTIAKFLGDQYELTASYGHVRDLPGKKIGVDIKNNFEPTYQAMPDKKKVLKDLKDRSKKADLVYIATDPDREGEAIAWHIIEGIQVPEEKVKRIVFNEITKTAVENAIQNSRDVDMDLVNAQQARRVLDRLIGYKLSPVLARKIRKGLSAGRVQSVAVKILCDREREIKAFIPKEYWNIDVTVSKENSEKHRFTARYIKEEKDESGDKTVKTQVEAEEIKAFLESASYTVEAIKKTQVKRNPAQPFITSTLQQEAARKLGWTSKKTMLVAQQLYEGVEIGSEPLSLITYMRTDSTRISAEAKAMAVSFIKENYGEKYLGEARAVKKADNVQDAHEAIRPSYLDQTPQDLSKHLSTDHLKLYKLIWNRFMASQMSPSISDRTQVTVAAKKENRQETLRATGSILVFDGFTKVYIEDQDQTSEEDNEDALLPPLEEKENLTKKAVEAAQKFTQPPAHFTEASLVKEMEYQGIGRPSTYAPTISTIIDRGYVVREAKQLLPTELGFLVIEKLEEYFTQVVDVTFTASMEKKLDDISEGKHSWQSIVGEFYNPFSEKIDIAYKEMEKVNTDKPSDEVCEKCNSPMLIKQGRFGEFLACSNFPDCKNTKSIIADLGINCPTCKSPMVAKKTRKGKVFYGCSGYPNCNYAVWDKPVSKECPKCKFPFVLEKAPKKGTAYQYCSSCEWKESDD